MQWGRMTLSRGICKWACANGHCRRDPNAFATPENVAECVPYLKQARPPGPLKCCFAKGGRGPLSSASQTFSKVFLLHFVHQGMGVIPGMVSRNSHGFANETDLRESGSDSQACLLLSESPCHRRSYVAWAQFTCTAVLRGGFAIRMDLQAKRICANPTPSRTCPLANPSTQQ